jgi:hypothetical protein
LAVVLVNGNIGVQREAIVAGRPRRETKQWNRSTPWLHLRRHGHRQSQSPRQDVGGLVGVRLGRRAQHPARGKQAVHPPGDANEDPVHLLILGWIELNKAQPLSLVGPLLDEALLTGDRSNVVSSTNPKPGPSSAASGPEASILGKMRVWR